jgi:chaperone modulatory protein CbpM
MSEPNSDIATGLILDEQVSLTLEDVCRACAVETTSIIALVEEGVLEPASGGKELQHWRFSGASLGRARIAMRLQRDLEINLAGVALTLELLSEIESLRAGLADR